jgi:hypothetical protein
MDLTAATVGFPDNKSAISIGDHQMKFLCIYKPAKPEGTPPTQEELTNMGKLVEESMKSGHLLSTEGCMPSALGARVRRTGDQYKVTDGPFSEAKEIIGGFALIQAKSKAEAIEHTKNFLKVAGDGETEIRQIFEMDCRSGFPDDEGIRQAWDGESNKAIAS